MSPSGKQPAVNLTTLPVNWEELPEGDVARVIAAAEEYLNRLQQGEKPDRQAFLDLHADIAKPLGECLDNLALLQRGAADLRIEVPAGPPSEASPQAIGDYRIIREIGRGGMGIVYEAEQLSLARKVALKVLPFAGMLDQRQLARFKTEAQTAAQLHHTNIVPVFAVGCDRGVHYYAMQYIEGQTLAAVIHQLRRQEGLEKEELIRPAEQLSRITSSLTHGQWPAPAAPASTDPQAPSAHPAATNLTHNGTTHSREYFRCVARLGIQAAEAIEHAHVRGVIHRDIKPSNLILDTSGNLWITDFGLASFRQNSDMTLTVPGDLIGTLRYMSPEQALAKRVPIDHRTDIYSLGVTLYELLTLHPAVAGETREQVLYKISEEQPSPLRKLNAAVPADLQTIVQKAMAKEPHERYATAQELADDLRRFVADEPILARRPTIHQRIGKWAKRHKAVVWAAAAVLVLATAASAVSTVLIWREKGLTDSAMCDADRQRQLALRYVEQLAWTEYTRGRQLMQAGQLADAETSLRQALTAYEQLASVIDTPESRRRRGMSRKALAELCSATGRLQDGIALYSGALQDLPEDAESNASLGAVLNEMPELKQVQLDEALRLSEKAVRLEPQNGRYWWTLAHARFRCGRWTSARDAFQESARQGLLRADTDFYLAIVCSKLGEKVAALDSYERGVQRLAWSGGESWFQDAAREKAADELGLPKIALHQTRSFFAHDRGTRWVAFPASGDKFISTGFDGTARLWRSSGTQLFQFLGHGAAIKGKPAAYRGVHSGAFSPSGRFVATGGWDGTVRIWDAATGKALATLTGHTDWVSVVAFSPDRKVLASASGDGSIKLWDAAAGTWKQLKTLRGHPREVESIAFAPDGSILASGGWDGAVVLWDTATWQQVAHFSVQPSAANSARDYCLSLAFSPDARHLAVGTEDGRTTLWDWVQRKQRSVIAQHGDRVWAVAFSPDGRFVASGAARAIILSDVQTGRRLYGTPSADLWALTFSPDGKELVAAGTTGDIVVWKVAESGALGSV